MQKQCGFCQPPNWCQKRYVETTWVFCPMKERASKLVQYFCHRNYVETHKNVLKYGLGRIIDLISTLILRRFQRGVLVGKFVLAWLTTDVSFLPTSHWFIQRYFGTSQQVWDLKYLPHIKEKLNTSKQFQWISLNVPQFVTTPNMIDNYLKVIIFLVNNPYLLHPYIFRTETNS